MKHAYDLHYYVERPLVGLFGSLAWHYDGARIRIAFAERPQTGQRRPATGRSGAGAAKFA